MYRMVSRYGVLAMGSVVAGVVGWLVGASWREGVASSAPQPSTTDCVVRLASVQEQIARKGESRASAPREATITWEECLRQRQGEAGRAAAQLRAGVMARAGVGGDLSPLAWAAPPPPEMTDAGFGEVLKHAIDECGVYANVVAVDCSEPPCVAALTTLDTSIDAHELARCAGPLFEPGPDGATRFSEAVEPLYCENSVEGRVILLSPGIDATIAHGGIVAPHGAEQAMARRVHRFDHLREGWACPD